MKYYLLVIVTSIFSLPNILSSQTPYTGKDSIEVVAVCRQLDSALINKDTAMLRLLLHPQLSFGHSNGWTETKTSLLAELPGSQVHYRHFRNLSLPDIQIISDELCTIRRDIRAEGTYKKKDFEVDLHVLEVWIKVNGRWRLLARQSVDF